ncbi:hypothetical protein GW17_00059551 [Ensete ventricosum]|nr:hypothetical protein GW17_00059551 [Ensete ventricosum]RZR96865.1 hypothetical protein BHM03_00025980 [Ensete ventricosum]
MGPALKQFREGRASRVGRWSARNRATRATRHALDMVSVFPRATKQGGNGVVRAFPITSEKKKKEAKKKHIKHSQAGGAKGAGVPGDPAVRVRSEMGEWYDEEDGDTYI